MYPTQQQIDAALEKYLRRRGGSCLPAEAVRDLADEFKLSDEERFGTREGSDKCKWENDVHWGRLHLANDGVIEKGRRGIWVLTDQ